MPNRPIQAAPNYTAPALVFAGLNLMWVFCLLWALVGYLPVLLLAATLNHVITRLRHIRT